MKTTLLLLLSIMGLSTRGFSQPVNSSQSGSPCSEGELLVKLQGDLLRQPGPSPHDQVGATVIRTFSQIGWQHVCLPKGMSVSEGMAKYKALPGVLAVEPNYPVEMPQPPIPSEPAAPLVGFSAASVPAVVRPNDPFYSSQWNLEKIGMPAAWAITTGSSNVVVAVIDTGVNYNHEDLAANMWRNPGETGLDANGFDKATNGVDDDNDGYVDDVHGINAQNHTGDPIDNAYTDYHGTGVAGILGAAGNNGKGVAGINWTVKIMAMAAWGGDLNVVPVQRILAAVLESFDYIIAMKRKGVNVRVISSGGGFQFFSQALQDAIDAAGAEGVLTVCTARNTGYNADLYPFSPGAADSPTLIAVAASDVSDVLDSYSNFGRTTIDLAAPSEVPSPTGPSASGYRTFSATSAATPHVAGAAALLVSVKPEATPLQLKAALMQSVDQFAGMSNKLVSGGRLNVARALQVLTNDNLPPVVVGSFPASAHTSLDAPVAIHFSKPMDRARVEAALESTPSVSGNFEWSDGDRTVRLVHSTPFVRTNYTLRVRGTAGAASGATLDGNFDRVPSGTPADDYIWTFSFPVANDDFANAQPISGATGTLAATTQYSTPDIDDRSLWDVPALPGAPYFSVWYRWTPDAPSAVTFDLTRSNQFAAVLSAFVGADLNHLIPVAPTGSRISFAALPGTSYSISVAGKYGGDTFTDSQWGNFVLSWYPPPPATLSSFFPTSGYIGTAVTLNGINLTGATAVLFNGVSAFFTNAPSTNPDFVITAFVPPGATTGPLTVVTPRGNSTLANVFTLLVAPALGLRALPGNQVELSWPVTGGAGFIPEAADTVPSAVWTRVTASVVTTNGLRTMKLPASSASKFYRMRKL